METIAEEDYADTSILDKK
jgi:hypothetical protein